MDFTSNLQHDSEELCKDLKERYEYLEAQDAKLLETIQQLHCSTMLRLLEKSDSTDNVACEDDGSRKVNDYMSKLKLYTIMYVNLNDKIDSDIKIAQEELKRSEANLMALNVSDEDLKQLDTKVNRYKYELTKLEKKYPWLKDTEHHLPNIAKEIETLNKLRNTKDTLLEDINAYCGLKPDISEANQQLKVVKREYEDFMKNFNEKLENV